MLKRRIEALERLEGNARSGRVVIVFEGDAHPAPEGATVIVVRFVNAGDRYDDQDSTR